MLEEARQISGLENPKSVQQLMKWLNKELETEDDQEITDLRKTTVAELLKAGVDSDKATRMLELRQQLGKTSTKKYNALQAAVCADGRVRGMIFYYGANRSGRWAGRIVQPQNLPQNHLDSLDFARELVKDLDVEMLKVCLGSVPDTLSQLIRTAFVPKQGKLFAVADYSAIEARVVAWLAGEQWVLDAFRAGKDIYCATASQMFGVPVEKHGENAHLRQRGKVATLALGYGGGESALTAMGALRMGIPEEDLPEIKTKWRQANPNICALWRRAEDGTSVPPDSSQASISISAKMTRQGSPGEISKGTGIKTGTSDRTGYGTEQARGAGWISAVWVSGS
jgi:DNA polymerase